MRTTWGRRERDAPWLGHHSAVDATADWYRDLENWHGSFLEVAIDLGARDDDRLRAAFAAAWESRVLVGPLDAPYPDRPRGVPDAPLDPEGFIHTYGTVELPNTGRRVGCEVLSVRDDESDWLDVALPTGMLELAYPVEYPLFDDTNPWIADVEGLLVSIANHIYTAVPFDLATVGEEVSGLFYARSSSETRAITRDVVDRGGGFLLSPRLWERLQPTAIAEPLASGLRWVPPTGTSHWAP